MEVGWLILGCTIGLVVFAFLARMLHRGPRGADDVEGKVIWIAVRAYVRLVHRLNVQGVENIPANPSNLLVVANHTSGVDPILVQSACRFFIRWMMAEDMRVPVMEPMLDWLTIISVDRAGGDAQAARTAIRYLKEGGVIGIFPEGGIERPPREVLPFIGGVGLIVRRSGATVLPVLITGTPYAETAYGSLYRSSHACIRFLEPINYAGTETRADAIVADLRRRFVEESGWPANDAPDVALIQR